ncbi:7411_t:CDS:2, partial [Dentiscutata heterogama]
IPITRKKIPNSHMLPSEKKVDTNKHSKAEVDEKNMILNKKVSNSSMSPSKKITSGKSTQKRKAEVDERDMVPIKKSSNSPPEKKIISNKAAQKRKAEVDERDTISIKKKDQKTRYNFLVKYITEKAGKKNFSYYDFLCNNQNEIIQVLQSISKPYNSISMDNAWCKRFVGVAEEKLDKKAFVELKNKDDIDRSRHNKKYKKFWEQILSEFKKPIPRKEISGSDAYNDLIKGDVTTFIQLLKLSLLTRSPMSLAPANEEVLQGIFETLLPPSYRIPQLRLVMNGQKEKGEGRFGFLDLFLLGEAGQGVSIELKYISTGGLLKAKTGQTAKKFDTTEHDQLDRELETLNEEALLKTPYTFLSRDNEQYIQITINRILENGIRQLKSYIKIIEKGNVGGYTDSGIYDTRISTTRKNKPNNIKGFLILVVGFRSILWRPVDGVSHYEYYKA